jgi:hypothetical protein
MQQQTSWLCMLKHIYYICLVVLFSWVLPIMQTVVFSDIYLMIFRSFVITVGGCHDCISILATM